MMSLRLLQAMSSERQSERQGSALIITILIVSVISTISFMVSALAISEFRKAGSLQDSIAAYYAAESGIEQGLLQYRLWHDAEISQEVYNAATAGAVRVTPTISTGTPFSVKLSPASSSTYAVKMWFKGMVIGQAKQDGTPELGVQSRQILRDSAVQISGASPKSLRLAWSPIGANGTIRAAGQPKYFVEVTASGVKNGQPQTERTVIKDTDPSQFQVNFDLDTVQSIRIKPWDMSALKYSLTLQDSQNKNMLFDNQISYIESTGTVGKAKRTLKVGVNRAGGTGLEAQDFVLYSGDNPILLQ